MNIIKNPVIIARVSSELVMEICCSCGKDTSVLAEKKQRRLLCSSTTQTVLETLICFIRRLQNSEVDSETISNGFICRSCVRLIERYQVLYAEVENNVKGHSNFCQWL